TGLPNPPIALQQAMARLGRLSFESGCEDENASIHMLITRCTAPLSTWAPKPLDTLPEYADAVLVDPAYRVPSEDCETIAQQAEGGALDDMLEHRMHTDLMNALGRLGADADVAYTTV